MKHLTSTARAAHLRIRVQPKQKSVVANALPRPDSFATTEDVLDQINSDIREFEHRVSKLLSPNKGE